MGGVHEPSGLGGQASGDSAATALALRVLEEPALRELPA
jgi:hypothetical protein